MPVQLNIFLLLFGGLQGLLLSLFLASKRWYKNGYSFLIIYILVMLLQVMMKVASKIWLMENLRFLYNLSYRLPFLYGPLAYLLVVFLLSQQRRFRATDMLHFALFIISMVVMIGYALNGQRNFLTSIFFSPVYSLWLQLATIVVYHFLAYRYWRLYTHSPGKGLWTGSQVRLRWIAKYILFSFIASLFVAMAVYFMYIYYPRWSNARFLFVALTAFIYWISYTALSQPSIFMLQQKENTEEGALATLLPKLIVHRRAKKYSNSGLSEEDITTIQASLQKIMLQQKPYLDTELTINTLAAIAQCNRHHLSQVLNDRLQQSFYDYVNGFRIDEARQLLLDPAKEDHKIASIAYDAGFNSLSTFNDVFRKKTGMTPSQFRKQAYPASKQQRG